MKLQIQKTLFGIRKLNSKKYNLTAWQCQLYVSHDIVGSDTDIAEEFIVAVE